MDEELKQLDLATAEARRLASAALDTLRTPQRALRAAAADYIESVASRRLDATRRASVEVMAKLSDDDIAELRAWTSEQLTEAREAVEERIESCDFWIPVAEGLSPSDVTAYSGGLMAKPRDSRTGIPQALVDLFDEVLSPFRRGLAAVGLYLVPADAEPRVEVALVRAWQTYRDTAVDCVSRWADVDEHYHASAERFQEMRWELAGEIDLDELKARREVDESEDPQGTITAQADEAAHSPPEATVRLDSETLVPTSG